MKALFVVLALIVAFNTAASLVGTLLAALFRTRSLRGLVLAWRAWRDSQDFKHGMTQLFIALDQLANVLSNPFSKNTWADETISSRCGRVGHRYPYRAWKWVIDKLLFSWWQGPNHCVNAYKKELTRYQFHPSMRGEAAAAEKKPETVVS